MLHRRLRLLILFVCATGGCLGQKEDWLPITPQDWQVKEAPGDPGAPAIQLYYADSRDDSRQYQFVYRRIKVLNDKGKRYADVEIPLPSYSHFLDLKARTIHPDGHIVEFTGKPFEKIAVKTRDAKTLTETFTLPEVTVGSIVEYKYRYTWDTYISGKTWELQHDLYTVREEFWIRPFTGTLNGMKHFEDEAQLSYVYSNLPSDVKPRDNGSVVELEAGGIPAFEAEESMPPQDNFRPRVRFFYGGREISSPDAFWQGHGKDWFAEAERFIGNHPVIKNAMVKAAGGENDPEKKLRKLYAFAQQTRNLSFERERTPEEEKAEDIRPNKNVVEVLEHGYGSGNDIARLFAALARAAGVESEIVRASSRKDYVFDQNFLSEDQLGTELVLVKLNGTEMFLDPGTRFCPFGLVYWIHTSVPALKLARNGGSFVVVPTPTADKAVSRRTVMATLRDDGSLTGEVVLEFNGAAALQLRLAILETDEAGKLRALEEELGQWQLRPSSVKLKDAQGWELSDAPLQVRFTFEIFGFAKRMGKRLLVPAVLFQTKQRAAFGYAERKYPVYFPYTFEEIDRFDLLAPDGFYVETLPRGQDMKLASSRFVTQRTLQENRITLSRALVVNSIYFRAESYKELKSFFDQLRIADEEQVVLQQGKTPAN